MCDLILLPMSVWNWGEIFKVLLGIWGATVATLALQTWRRQSKAQKQTEFLDDLTESVLEFMQLLKGPIELVRFVKMDVDSFAGLPEIDKTLENPEAVAYIKERGKKDSERLREYLKPCAVPISKIHSLLFKGQVFGFKNYPECRKAYTMITWQYERIDALCYIIGSDLLNWKNPKVQEHLRNFLAIDPNVIENQIKEQTVKFLVFVEENYRAIYK
jgi:hypothetical protein